MCHGFFYNILKNQLGTPVTLAVNAKKTAVKWGFFAREVTVLNKRGKVR